jgi:hypothetical protein
MTVRIRVDNKHICNAGIVNVMRKVIISIVARVKCYNYCHYK